MPPKKAVRATGASNSGLVPDRAEAGKDADIDARTICLHSDWIGLVARNAKQLLQMRHRALVLDHVA